MTLTRALILASLLAALPAAAPVRADTAAVAVVLASTAPGHATGQVLTDRRIEVPDGASATFLLANGQMMTVKGPYAGELASPKAGRAGGLGGLLVGGADRSEIGGTRSLARPAPVTLTIDPGTAGTYCLTDDVEPVLQHPADPAFADVELRDPASGRAVRIEWVEGSGDIPWPAALPLSDATLDVTSLRSGAQRELVLRWLGGNPRSEAAKAAALAFAGCTRQAAGMLERLREVMVPLDIYLASDRGRYPVYRPGDLVELLVQTNRDAFVYCVVRDARGETVSLFPPRPTLARIDGHRPLRLPGSSLPFALRAGETLADGEVRCIASERDLAAELPQLASAGMAQPLSAAALEALDATITDPRQGRMVMAQLILRLER